MIEPFPGHMTRTQECGCPAVTQVVTHDDLCMKGGDGDVAETESPAGGATTASVRPERGTAVTAGSSEPGSR